MRRERTRHLSIWWPFATVVISDTRVDRCDSLANPPGNIHSVAMWIAPHPVPMSDLEMISDMRGLRVVQLLSSGADHVLPYVPNGVTVCTAPQLRAESTAETALCLALAAANGVVQWCEAQRDRRWTWLPARSGLVGRSMAIIGYGNVGQTLHRMVSGFGMAVMPVAFSSRPGVLGAEDLDAVLPAADVVAVTVPLTARTQHLFDYSRIALLKDGALLVNVSRGGVVDTEALVEALWSGRIAAALDVTDPEPLPPEHPLWTCPNLLISPHVGGSSAGIGERSQRYATEQIERYLANEPLQNVFDPSRWL